MYQRRTFTDFDTSEVWRLPKNPRSMGSIHSSRRTTGVRTPTGVVLVTRPGVGGFPWAFQGRLHSEAEYDDFEAWAKREHVIVTDHRGRGHRVIPVGFEPVAVNARQNGTRNPWLFDYTFNTIYLGRQP